MNTQPNPVKAQAAAQAVLQMIKAGLAHDFLRDWFTQQIGGTIGLIPGGYRITAHGYSWPGHGTLDCALAEWAAYVNRQTRPDPLATFVTAMAGKTADEIAEAMQTAVIASGGTWFVPQGEHWPASHYAEVQLFNVYAAGSDLHELTLNWLKAAQRVMTGEMAA